MSRRGTLVLHWILACVVAFVALSPTGASAADQCTKELCIDRATFYEGLRQFNRTHPLAQDPKKLSVRSFRAMQDILDHWDTTPELTDTRWLAYIVATVFWETGGHLYPVREGLCDDEKCSLSHLEKLWKRRMVRQRYWDPDPQTGQSYYGRGQVQLTHLVNYWRVGSELERTQPGDDFQELGDKLVAGPDLALMDYVSTSTLVEGMVRGWFNAELGKGLGSYINDVARNDRAAYLEARRTVNGMDQRDLLADFALEIAKFVKAVPARSARTANVDAVTAEIPPAPAEKMEGADGKVRRKSVAEVEKEAPVGPVSEAEPAPTPPRSSAIDFDKPVGPIKNLTGVVGGAAAAAATGNIRTPPTKKEQRALRKKRKQRERRKKKRQKQRKKNQKKNRR